MREMAEAETGSKLSLTASGAPIGTVEDLEYGSGGGTTALGRRRSLAEAAWVGPWRPDLEVGDSSSDNMVGGGFTPAHLSDPWDSTSPAMKRDWATEDRIEDTSRPGPMGDDERARLRQSASDDAGSPPYQHLPLRSASEMSAAQRAAADSVAAAAASAPLQPGRQLYGAPVYPGGR